MKFQKMLSKLRQRRVKEGEPEGIVYSYTQNGILFHDAEELAKFTDSRDDF